MQKIKSIINYRDASISDLFEIVAIYNSTISSRMVTADTEPVTVAQREQWFYEHNAATRPLWMAEDENNNCIGWVSFQNFYGRKAYEGTAEISIYLHGNKRGKGYGKQMLQYAIEKAASLHIHSLLGYIFAHNEPSINLFLQAGFSEWAHLRDIALMDGQYFSLKIFGKKV